ncbi:MAG: beta-glucosidase BglX [Cyclobacteriaceae bacterium]|nr:beta-glucosidase BglX [Cyclobacteriaceae bacterium]MCH8516957.1 beta-glucosidase BglX [Cyclobacteriaceae bacterium]
MTKVKVYMGIFLILIVAIACNDSKTNTGDNGKNYESKIDSIINIMTLEEKAGQMVQYTSGWDVTGPVIDDNYEEYIASGRVGSIFNAHTSAYNRNLQKIAVEETRLGIPLIFGYDVIHGYKTIFPISLGESASWDLDAMERSARIAAEEASAAGLHWTFAPMIDISFEPRWGRVSEGAGEDTYFVSQVAKARVKGFQGEDLMALNTLAACAKHFAAYGAPQAGRDYHTVDMSERVLRDVYLPPFKAAIDAGVRTFMTSFNEYDGVPATGSEFLFQQILREEWGFDGFVVTDYTAINEMIEHGVAKDLEGASELAINAGIDMDMQGGAYLNHLIELVDSGKVKESQLDEAVRRILRIKFELGLFDDPYRYSNEEREKETIMKDEFIEAARDIARKSIVLLKNDNNTLPISESKIKNIALVGPLSSTKEVLGSWHASGDYEKAVSLKEGLENNLPANIKLAQTEGTGFDTDDESGFAAAKRIAAQSDVIIMALGESEHMGGEAASRTSIEIPGNQMKLFNELKATGKPIVAVLMNSRPLAISELDNKADAILETWFLGTEAGNAIADVIFGEYNPSAKLPVTFPRSLGQVPIHYNMKNTGRPIDHDEKYTSKYIDSPNDPLYPFGYGLSYTSFDYSDLSLNSKKITKDDELKVSVKVENTGEVDGEEVVQLYIQDLVGSVTRPVKELKGFKKLMIKAGQTETVDFTITEKDLRFYTKNMDFASEPGEFKVYVGGNSEDVMEVLFTLE